MSTVSDDKDADAIPIMVRTARSGKVDYADAVVLHQSKVYRIRCVPHFVRRTQGTKLSIKLIAEKFRQAPYDWDIDESRTLTLNEDAARSLLRMLRQHLAVAEHDTKGDFIAIRVTDGQAHLASGYTPETVAQALVNVLGQADIVRHLSSRELGSELVGAFRTAIRLQELRDAVATLRAHLDEERVDEAVYQDWCERHTWAFGNAYVVRDEVRDISTGDRLDLMLPTVIAGYRDIVELKRPNMEVLIHDVAHKNYYFAAEVSKAIGQSHRYLDVLHEEAAKGLRDHPEIVAYHPRATIVIGRSKDWSTDKLRALHGLNRRMHGIAIITYDQLLAQGERLVEVLSASVASDEPLTFDLDDTWGGF